MELMLLCQHCGHRTSQIIIAQGEESDTVELDEGQIYDLDFSIWFTCCNNCRRHSLFSALDNEPLEAVSLFPAERMVSDKVPKEISNAYKEAIKVKKISKYAFVILVRRALEIICKHEKTEGKNLPEKIKDLGQKNIISPKLADMADLIRLIGNSSAHASDIKIDDYDIDILEDFFVAIIDYVYSVHEKIELLKGKIKNAT
jgi:hypothetical protein